jgi:CubicO group peptidase (beta-lactamase class C family)
LFQAGSISKTVTALLVLNLASEGCLRLDDPVNAHLKSWKLPDSEAGGHEIVAIRHLLSHSAGLAPITYPAVQPGDTLPILLDLLNGAAAAKVPPVTRVEPPGRGFAYSNPAYLVLEQMLSDLSGTAFADLARSRLFAPLGMAGTTFAPHPPIPLYDRAAWGHGQGLVPIASKGLVAPAALGGLWTTPSDLARLLVALFASYRCEPGTPFNRTLAREALQPQVEGQGLCGAVEGSGPEHRLTQMGAMPGFTAYLVGLPESGSGAVIMINAGGRSGDLALELARAIAVEYGWPGYVREYERVTLPAGALAAFAGEYEFANPAYPKIQIVVKEGGLYWAARQMQAVAGGMFVIPSAGIEVHFVRDGNGTVVAADYGTPGMRRTRITRIR